MTGNLTVGALLERGIRQLRDAAADTVAPDSVAAEVTGRSANIAEPGASDTSSLQLDTEVLLSHALGMSRAQLKSHPETTPAADRVLRFTEMIRRRAAGEPLAYITGRREFWSLPLIVNPAVLVPRPETELLVERALALKPEHAARIADLGTGSGAIALALASERPQWLVTATDLSAQALSLARENAAALGLSRIQFQAGDWFEPLTGQRFDLIVSNPPYVADTDPALRQLPLSCEPRMALTAGSDGLACLRVIIQATPIYLERHGWLVLEHGSMQAADVARELVVRGFRHVRSHRDLTGHERVTEAQWL